LRFLICDFQLTAFRQRRLMSKFHISVLLRFHPKVCEKYQIGNRQLQTSNRYPQISNRQSKIKNRYSQIENRQSKIENYNCLPTRCPSTMAISVFLGATQSPMR
jgi:hypothetical protein